MMKKFQMATIAAAGAMIFSTAPASAAPATNPPFSGCPAPAICLYKNGGGTGTKVIVGGAFAPGTHNAFVGLAGVNFLDGSGADNQVTSWLNNTNCGVEFRDADTGNFDHDIILDFAPPNNFGRTGDWANTGLNDRLGGLLINC